MKAAVIEQQGGVENIVYRDWDDPEPVAGEVRVRVEACGLNHLDIFVRRGMPGFPVPMPFISGGDIAGTIDSLGDGVTGWSVGDRVTMNPQTDHGMIGEELVGGLAELICVPAINLVALPDNVTMETAAAIPINY
ncbi:MAG: alcohol dehydrogenase, partial [Alphaproteobacteria bacterium]